MLPHHEEAPYLRPWVLKSNKTWSKTANNTNNGQIASINYACVTVAAVASCFTNVLFVVHYKTAKDRIPFSVQIISFFCRYHFVSGFP